MRSIVLIGLMVLVCFSSCQEPTPKQALGTDQFADPDRRDPIAYEEARMHHESGDLIGAKAGYDDVLKDEPEHIGALGNRAILMEGRGDIEAALNDYEILLEQEGENVPALVHRAALLARTGKHGEAVRDFDLLVLLRPQDPLIRNDRGFAHYNLNDFEAALIDFESALIIAPDLSPARINLGNSRYVLGEYAAAKADFEAVLKREPDNVDALLALGKYWLFQENQPDSSAGYYKAALRHAQNVNPEGEANAHLGLGNLKFMEGKIPEAIAEFSLGLVLRPDMLELRMNRGLARYRIQAYPEAIEDYDQVLELQPGSSAALAMRGYAKCESGMTSSGCIDLQAAMNKGETQVKEAIVKYCKTSPR
jgi:tetratricopeptide (TPR) repeat protein